MELLILVLVIACPLAMYAHDWCQYRKTTYFNLTNNSYSHTRSDKGRFGEYSIYKSLRQYEQDNGKFLFNVYIPKAGSGVTEIDVILICKKGIFVFESKNYSGWIFGDEIRKEWMQTLPIGRGRSRKEPFYNPIMQNAAHIRYLKKIIGYDVPVASIIVFSDRCTLKNVIVRSASVRVIKCRYVANTVADVARQRPGIFLTAEEIDEIYTKLYLLTGRNRMLQHTSMWK